MIRLAVVVCILGLCLAVVLIRADRLAQIKPGMTANQVEAIMGRPASIEQSESADQTVSGEVDHYSSGLFAASGDARVVLVNHTVFRTEFIPSKKS